MSVQRRGGSDARSFGCSALAHKASGGVAFSALPLVWLYQFLGGTVMHQSQGIDTDLIFLFACFY